MSAAAEAPFIYAFAALLAIGSIVLLFVPLFLHVQLFSASRFVFAAVIAGLSEQLAMALGASLLIVRTGFRFRPRLTLGLWPIWIAATLFAIAFVVVAPYAFPDFEAVYLVSGLAGWILGAFVVSRMD